MLVLLSTTLRAKLKAIADNLTSISTEFCRKSSLFEVSHTPVSVGPSGHCWRSNCFSFAYFIHSSTSTKENHLPHRYRNRNQHFFFIGRPICATYYVNTIEHEYTLSALSEFNVLFSTRVSRKRQFIRFWFLMSW